MPNIIKTHELTRIHQGSHQLEVVALTTVVASENSSVQQTRVLLFHMILIGNNAALCNKNKLFFTVVPVLNLHSHTLLVTEYGL